MENTKNLRNKVYSKIRMEKYKMRSTGIVRRIDSLGRIVIPKEIRRTMNIKDYDALEMFTEKEGRIILKKYSPIKEMGNSAQQCAEAIAAQIPHTVCICDQDEVIAAVGRNAKELFGKLLHEKAEEALLERKNLLMERDEEEFFPLITDFPEIFRYVCLATIISEGEAIGLVCILSSDEELTHQELLVARIGAGFLGKQLEL